MGLGSTAKKIQGISDKAEQMYGQVQELQQRIFHLEEEVDDTHDTVKNLDREMAEQRALLKAMAEEQGLDAEAILTEAAIQEAEADGETADEASDPEQDVAEDAEGDSTGDGEAVRTD